MSNVRLSIYRDIKISIKALLFPALLTSLVLDLEQYKQAAERENPKLIYSLLDLLFLAEIVKEIILP